MGLVQFLFSLFVVGVVLAVVNKSPFEPWIKMLINAIVLIAVVAWTLKFFGYDPGFNTFHLR